MAAPVVREVIRRREQRAADRRAPLALQRRDLLAQRVAAARLHWRDELGVGARLRLALAGHACAVDPHAQGRLLGHGVEHFVDRRAGSFHPAAAAVARGRPHRARRVEHDLPRGQSAGEPSVIDRPPCWIGEALEQLVGRFVGRDGPIEVDVHIEQARGR